MRALVGVLGLLLGLLVGASTVLLNPLAWMRGLPPLSSEIGPFKAYRGEAYRGIDLGAGSLLRAGRQDPEAALNDPALRHVRIAIIVLPAGAGAPAALAVKVSAAAESNSLWRAQLGTNDYWNIYWPGEGSIFATGYSNYWAVTRDGFFAVLGGDFDGARAAGYPVSAPPPPGSAAGVTGAAGRYAGFTGEIRELWYPRAGNPRGTDPDWAVAIKANPPPVTAR